jgi:thiamine pyrophosphate-dependent acetolactate synthase large subunit-like protein
VSLQSFPAALATAIAAEGVEHVFGLMGAGTIQLTHHLVADFSVKYHAVRHESAAVNAADGFARTGAGVGVALISSGPGFSNGLTALHTAKRGASPLVLIAPDSDLTPPLRHPFAGGAQKLDESSIAAMLDALIVRSDPRTVYADVAAAFGAARERQTPVVLLYPFEANSVSAVSGETASTAARRAIIEPRQTELEAAAAVFSEAERPLVLAGLGAARAGAEDALLRLADRSGALLATSLRGAGLFVGHPYNLGICGGFATEPIADLIAQSDCVLAVGASLNGFTTRRSDLMAGKRIVHCDVDPSAFYRYERPDVAVFGDAKRVAEALYDLVEPRAESAYRAAAEAAGLVSPSLLHPFEDVSQPGRLDPRAVCRRIDELLPEARTVVADCNSASEFPVEHVRILGPESLLWMFDFGALGSGLGAALGAALARPERRTVLFLGDGGLFMTLGDLDTFVRERLPVLVVCLNDRAYGAEISFMRSLQISEDIARFETPDLTEIARAIGWEAATISELGDFERYAQQIANLDRPLLLNCLITEDPVYSPLRPHV